MTTLLLVGILLQLLLLISHADAAEANVKGTYNREDTPLNAVIIDGSDMASRMGAELIQGLHVVMVQCQIKIHSADMKHQRKISKMIKYFEGLEKAVVTNDFPGVEKQNKMAIETNTHRSINQLEIDRRNNLHKIAKSCKAEEKEWLSDKFSSLLANATILLSQNSTKYIELILKMSYYKEKITKEMKVCKNASSPEYLSLDCYINEMQMVAKSVSDFLQSMEDVYNIYHGDSEEEDPESKESSSSSAEGSGSGEESDSEVELHVTSSSGPADSGKEDAATSQQGEGATSTTQPQQQEIGSTTTSQKDTSQSPDSPDTNVAWVDEAFEEVAEIGEKEKTKTLSLDNSVKTKGASQSSVEIHGSLGGGGGGDEVDINVEFDLHEGLPSLNPNKLIFDGDDNLNKKTTPWTVTHYIIISFTITLGVMLILIVITVVSIVMYKRRGRERRKMVSTDFSSDKDMLDVMKKSGYVNPTYKYYTQT